MFKLSVVVVFELGGRSALFLKNGTPPKLGLRSKQSIKKSRTYLQTRGAARKKKLALKSHFLRGLPCKKEASGRERKRRDTTQRGRGPIKVCQQVLEKKNRQAPQEKNSFVQESRKIRREWERETREEKRDFDGLKNLSVHCVLGRHSAQTPDCSSNARTQVT